MNSGLNDYMRTYSCRRTEYTNPVTRAKVPVEVKAITTYSENGISCREIIKDGDRESTRELWNLELKSGDLDKVKNLLDGFDDEQRLTFATQKSFWEDYLSGNMDVEGFKEYFATTDNGVIAFEKKLAEGEKLKDIVSEPYAAYLNNNSFVGHAWTEQEMWDNWNARIEASQKTVKLNGSGVEPPTETIVTKSGSGGSMPGEKYAKNRVAFNINAAYARWYDRVCRKAAGFGGICRRSGSRLERRREP